MAPGAPPCARAFLSHFLEGGTGRGSEGRSPHRAALAAVVTFIGPGEEATWGHAAPQPAVEADPRIGGSDWALPLVHPEGEACRCPLSSPYLALSLLQQDTGPQS